MDRPIDHRHNNPTLKEKDLLKSRCNVITFDLEPDKKNYSLPYLV